MSEKQFDSADSGDFDATNMSNDDWDEFEVNDLVPTHGDAAEIAENTLDQLATAWLAGHDTDIEHALDVSPSVGTVLQQLVQAGDGLGVDPMSLVAFSDLSSAAAELVRREWTLIPETRRYAVITYLVALAEEELGLFLGPILRIALQDSSPAVRALALEGLWEDNGTDLIGPFVQILLNDEDNDVRAVAAQALGTFVLAGELDDVETALSMRAEEALLSVLLNPTQPLEVRRRALESIAYSGEAGVRQLIEDAYYDSEEEMRISSLIAMGRSADIRWRGLVRAELRNPSPAMRGEAAIACGELEARAARGELIALLQDDEQFVRLAAISALGQIGGKAAQEALRNMRESEDPVEIEAADLALEELLFLQDDQEISLYDEDELLDEWDQEPWDQPYDADDEGDWGDYADE
jgi:HEAT repeat protein